MIVTKNKFFDTLDGLEHQSVLSLDTETTGLNPYGSDQLFSIVISDGKNNFYFNFHDYGKNFEPEYILPRTWLKYFHFLFKDVHKKWFLHNAKFDLAMLDKEGLTLAGTIHCTFAIARIEYNRHMKYDLNSCATRIGQQKSDIVEKYIKEHKECWQWINIPGKKTRTKQKFFHKVPFKIMQFYAERDAKVTYDLGMYQIISLRDMDSDFAALFEKKHRPMLVKKLSDVYANEMALTKTCFNMEKIGIKIDRKYIVDARLHESIRMKEAVNEFETLTGQPFKNSSKRLAEIFAGLKEEVGRTAKGNLSVDEGALSKMKHPAARAVLKYRDSEKRGNTYFSSYLYWADASDVIHANIKPNGTDTGRFSYGDPNLQNIPKEDSGQFKVRRAFVPRPGYFFGMLDYDQVEYRIMADYSREQTLIDKIMKEGLDVHQACADMMNVTRNEAKTINFMLLYGGGVKKLAAALNIEFEQAEMLRNKYFYTLPNVKEFIRTVIDSAQNSERGYVINWLGRRCHFEDPKFAYKAPNHLIQGGAADVTKVAMNRIDAFLKDKKSRMLVQIHDELLLEIHESEAHILTDIKEIMENSYSPRNGLKLTCGIEHSFISWADKVEGIPSR